MGLAKYNIMKKWNQPLETSFKTGSYIKFEQIIGIIYE
jgi:hypothetical protein